MEIAFGFCHCGCGGETSIAKRTVPRFEMVKGQPVRYIRNHHMRIVAGTEYIITARGCWEWQHALDSHGYAQRMIDGRVQLVHRAMYVARFGRLPWSTKLDHLCRNPKCVNPDHLEPVSNAENCRRGRSAKLTMAAAQSIRELYALGGVTQAALSAQFGVAQTIISKVISQQIWSGT